uniref:Uncharacterized protein n=2 Tax=Lutzomyia longipalpis TaxID=7200 RepID=A0A1B0CWS9_LUTLO
MRKDSQPHLSVPVIHISTEKKVSQLKEKFDAKASKKDIVRTKSPNGRVAKCPAGGSSKTDLTNRLATNTPCSGRKTGGLSA